jgi:hypothetical protein
MMLIRWLATAILLLGDGVEQLVVEAQARF